MLHATGTMPPVNTASHQHGDGTPTRTTPNVIPELQAKQARDWQHRGGFDPPNTWGTLWHCPIDTAINPQAAKDSPPCQCGQRACAAMAGCGICVHDPVVCWSCNKYFHGYCVAGFAGKILGGMAMDQGISADIPGAVGMMIPPESPKADEMSILLGWAQCPQCHAQLGASAVPSVLLNMKFMSAFPQSTSGLLEPGLMMTSTIVRAIKFEVDYCLNQVRTLKSFNTCASKTAVKLASLCTRAINCINRIRAMGVFNFTPELQDNFYYAHFARAKLELNKKVYRAIRNAHIKLAGGKGADASASKASKASKAAPRHKHDFRSRSQGDQDFASAFISSATFVEVTIALRVHPLRGNRQYDALGMIADQDFRTKIASTPFASGLNSGTSFQPWPDLDPGYEQADFERRGMRQFTVPLNQYPNLYRMIMPGPDFDLLPGGAPVAMINSVDYRWAFRSSEAAVAYYKDHVVVDRAETNASSPLRCTPKIASLDGADDFLYLTSITLNAPLPPFLESKGCSATINMFATNTLFRVKRVVGKVYLTFTKLLPFTDIEMTAIEKVSLEIARHAVAQTSAALEHDVVDASGRDDDLQGVAMAMAQSAAGDVGNLPSWMHADTGLGDDVDNSGHTPESRFPRWLVVDAHVRVNGLKSKPELNGKVGVVKEILDTGRAAICMAHPMGATATGGGISAGIASSDATKTIALRPANLHPVQTKHHPDPRIGPSITIINQNGATSGFEMRFALSTLGAGGPNQNTSRIQILYSIKKFKPHSIYDLFVSGVCGQCGFVGARRKCSRCLACSYCDAECQRQHWRHGHKDVCKKGTPKD